MTPRDLLIEKIIKEASSNCDEETGLHICIARYCEENGIDDEDIQDDAYQLSFKRSALEAGIPLSVIEGKTTLRDHFSQEYIDFKCNKKSFE